MMVLAVADEGPSAVAVQPWAVNLACRSSTRHDSVRCILPTSRSQDTTSVPTSPPACPPAAAPSQRRCPCLSSPWTPYRIPRMTPTTRTTTRMSSLSRSGARVSSNFSSSCRLSSSRTWASG